MKIQITPSEPSIDGYIWASPQNKEVTGEFFKCWEFCMEAQCTEIYAPDILDYFSIGNIEKIVPMWAKLLCPGGKIIIGGTDFYILAKLGLRREFDLTEINNKLFKKDVKSLTCANYTRAYLESLKFKINNVQIDSQEFAYTVEGIKGA